MIFSLVLKYEAGEKAIKQTQWSSLPAGISLSCQRIISAAASCLHC